MSNAPNCYQYLVIFNNRLDIGVVSFCLSADNKLENLNTVIPGE